MANTGEIWPMEDHIRQSLTRAQRGADISDQLFDLCHSHAISEDPDLLIQAGVLLGEFANNLRSALNYTCRAILQREVITEIAPKEAKKLQRNLDFPWAENERAFARKAIIRASRKNAEPLYRLLKRFQPFKLGNEWLAHLMILSNRDKHIVTNAVRSPSATSFLSLLPDGTQLKEPPFVGDKLVIFEESGPVGVELPFYYSPLKSFATARKTWSLYLVPFSPGFSLDLIDYTRTAPIRVTQILAAMDAQFGRPPAGEEPES